MRKDAHGRGRGGVGREGGGWRSSARVPLLCGSQTCVRPLLAPTPLPRPPPSLRPPPASPAMGSHNALFGVSRRCARCCHTPSLFCLSPLHFHLLSQFLKHKATSTCGDAERSTTTATAPVTAAAVTSHARPVETKGLRCLPPGVVVITPRIAAPRRCASFSSPALPPR